VRVRGATARKAERLLATRLHISFARSRPILPTMQRRATLSSYATTATPTSERSTIKIQHFGASDYLVFWTSGVSGMGYISRTPS
jgi:hypothetical protein